VTVGAVNRARKVWSLLTPGQRRKAARLLLLMIVGMGLETLGIGLVIPALAVFTDRSAAAHYPILGKWLGGGDAHSSTAILVGVAVLIAVYLVKSLFLAILAWRQTRFAFEVQADMSLRLFQSYLLQPYSFHLQRNSANLIRNIINEINIFTFNGLLPAMLIMTEALVLVGLGALLFFIEPLGAVIAITVLTVASWVFHSVTVRRLAYWGGARQRHDGLRIQHLQQGLNGVKDVKILGRESAFLDEYRHHNTLSARAVEFQITLQQLPRLWIESLGVVGLGILVMTMVLRDQPIQMVLPTLGLFAAVAFRLMPSANRVVSSIQMMRYCWPVIDTLYQEFLLIRPTDHESEGGLIQRFATLEMKGVSFTYPGAPKPALKNATLRIEEGQSIGFIGESGAGKSTLVDILLGLLLPDQGRVEVNGFDIRNDLRGWQRRVGYVPQFIYLTDDSLRRNVGFGLPDDAIDDEKVHRALRAAQLEEFVAELPSGLDTVVGERGVRLSGGQRQRIGIARALYHDPDVLVLDEATSSLDVATERDVMNAVAALHGSKTTLIVAHRMTTLEHCDRIFRLHGGQVVETTRSLTPT
jgi:ATP-binding cassette, subfamily B, bacterial PglK